MAGKSKSLSDSIRRAVKASGKSNYRLAKDLGIAESSMCRFMLGQTGLSMAVLDKLWVLLDLEVSTKKQD